MRGDEFIYIVVLTGGGRREGGGVEELLNLFFEKPGATRYV